MSFTTRPELRGTFGMVASTHWLASAAGMAVLEQGGNAFDAAVATGLTLQVVEPHLNGPGGDLPALLWPAGREEPIVLCAQGPAPQRATIAHYRDELGLRLVPGTGPLAAVVPGAFGGWMAMLRDFGTLRLRDVVRFAIGYAEDGYPMLPQIAGAIRNVEALFRDEWTTSAEVYLPAVSPGSLARNATLAATYRRVLEEAESGTSDRDGQIDAAHDAWYSGFVAEAFVAFSERSWMDSSGERHAGLLAEDDLRDWRPRYEAPLAVDYHGVTVLKAGPWSQAPVFLQQLRLLEGFDLPALGPGSAAYVHTLTECAKLAFADREAWYGDPDFVDVPLDEAALTRVCGRAAALVSDECSSALRPGAPDGRVPRLPSLDFDSEIAEAAGVGEPTRAGAKGDTVHLDVVDRFGNMVAATPSGGWLWGAPVVPELGFCLGTRAQMFWLEEGLAELARAGQAPADDALADARRARRRAVSRARHARRRPAGPVDAAHAARPPALRPRPTGRDRRAQPPHGRVPELVLSARFGAAPLAVEERVGEETVAGLQDRGHDVEVSAPWSLGRVSAVGRERDGVLKAAASPRGAQGYAVGR